MSLTVKHLRKRYKEIEALKSLSFTLEPGKCIALLGPNGAGKSTAVRCLVTLQEPDGGELIWEGRNLFENPPEIREMIGYVSQEMAMDKMMTGEEMMRFCAGIMHLDWSKTRDRAHELLDQMGLGEAKKRLVGDYSGGMKRRLDLAAALLNEPPVLILDEPTTGLDIEARETIWQLIREFLDEGRSLILASHDFREVAELADDIVILREGSVVAEGAPETLKTELGHLVIRLQTREFMTETDLAAARDFFADWGDQIVWLDGGEAEMAVAAYRGKGDLSEVQTRVYQAVHGAGAEVYALEVNKPKLEDVYRFAVGGAL